MPTHPCQAVGETQYGGSIVVRWVHELAFASPSQVTVSDGTSDHSSLTPILIELGVDGITEVTGKFGEQRRRFLNLDLIWSN